MPTVRTSVDTCATIGEADQLLQGPIVTSGRHDVSAKVGNRQSAGVCRVLIGH